MKIFKSLTASLLAPVLLLSSPGVLAQGQLIETVPKFYYLEEMEGGEVVHVRACYRGTADKESEFSALGLGCTTTIEVAAQDLEKFVRDLEHELSVAKAFAVIEHKSDRARGNVVRGFFVVFNSVVLFPMSLHAFSHIFSKELSYVGRHRSAIIGILLAALSLTNIVANWGGLTREEEEVSFPPSIEQGLLTGLDSGVVTGIGEEYAQLHSEIMQRFTDFLNEFAKPVQVL